MAVVLPLMTVTWVIASLYVGLGITALGWIYLVLLIITVSGTPTTTDAFSSKKLQCVACVQFNEPVSSVDE